VRVIEPLEEAAMLELRVRHHAVAVHERVRRDAGGEQRLHRGVARAGAAPRAELGVEAVVRGVPARRRVEGWIARPGGVAERAAERAPLLVARDGEPARPLRLALARAASA
jgi:hypothetical protein